MSKGQNKEEEKIHLRTSEKLLITPQTIYN